jgi:nucleoside-diphosphate-sugar epimerase
VKILIAGCGDVGTKTALLLAKQGHQVWGVKRNPSSLPKEIHPVQADLTQSNSFSALPQDIDIIFYTTAASQHTEEGYQQAYILGLKNIIQHYQNTDIKHLFFTSSTSVYHQQNGEWIDEDSETNPIRFSGKTMLQAEQIVRELSYGSSSIRFGGIYGKSRSNLIQTVEKQTPTQKNPPYYTNRIHVDDCAGLLAHLLEKKQNGIKLESIYLGIDNDPATIWDVKKWIAESFNFPLVPEKTTENPQQNKRCKNTKIVKSGYQFQYPSYQEGYLKK